MAPNSPFTVGVISDTHGLLRPEAIAALAGASAILHAGDVGDPNILEQLRALAPVTAIRGNIDNAGACAALAAEEYVSIAGTNFYLVHDRAALSIHPEVAGIHAVIFGHSHKPALEIVRGVTFFNPGAAGPRRFKLPITVGRITLAPGATPRFEHIPLLP